MTRKPRPLPNLPEQAILALIRWRLAWERESVTPPTINNGHMPSEIHMWNLAGRLMKIRGIKHRKAAPKKFEIRTIG